MIGIGEGMGGVPTLEETYDPQSRHHVLQGSYPSEASVTRELNELVELLEEQQVEQFLVLDTLLILLMELTLHTLV